jgi:hypothetical protein
MQLNVSLSDVGAHIQNNAQSAMGFLFLLVVQEGVDLELWNLQVEPC